MKIMGIMGLKKVKLQMMNSCPLAATVHVQTLFFKRVRERKLPRKRILSGFLVVNVN